MIHYCEHNLIVFECTICTVAPEQEDMFSEPKARTTDPATSHTAARMVDAAGQRGRIMEVLRAIYRDVGLAGGLTADQLDEMIGWRLTTAGRRLSELRARELVIPCGERKTRSGRPATVYRAVA